MNKRAIAILGAIFILIVGTLGFLIYQRTRSSSQEQNNETPVITEEPTNEEPVAETPQEPTTRATRLTDDAVVSPILFYQGNGVSYFSKSGQLFQTDLELSDSAVLLSNKRELAIALKDNIARILWPQTGNSFIAEFDGSGKKSWSYYDSGKGVYVDIPSQVYSLDWLPTGDKIMFIWVDASGKATLNIANADTTDYQVLTDLYEPDNVISIAPDGKNILFYRTQTQDTTKNTINMVTADGKTFRSIIKEGYNRGVKWSPNSNKFLFTKRDSASQKFTLWVADVATGEIKNLGLNTSVDKATWSKDGQTVFVAVPTRGTAGEGLTEDSMYRVVIDTGDKQEFAPGIAVDMQDLFLSSNQDIVFFRNAQDNSLYYMNVK